MKLFSTKNRQMHLGPYAFEKLDRVADISLENTPPMAALDFTSAKDKAPIIGAMHDYQAMLDAIRTGLVAKVKSQIPDDLTERSNHLKSFAYFSDVSVAGIAQLPREAVLKSPLKNPGIARLAEDLKTKQVKSLASGVDVIMADLKDTMNATPSAIDAHTHCIVFAYEMVRDPTPDEAGCDWIQNAQEHRACLRASETACVLANYLRTLGYDARAHSMAASDVDLNKLALAAGVGVCRDGVVEIPYLGRRFGLSAVTTRLELAPDRPLAQTALKQSKSLAWRGGLAFGKAAQAQRSFAKRAFADGPHPFERLKRVDTPTTFIDEPRIPRVPKRTDMFARALLGDMGKTVQDGAKNGHYVRKSAPAAAQRRALGALILLQDGEPAQKVSARVTTPEENANNIKAACYFLGVDAVGISRCPEWVWYSHDARGEVVKPAHEQAISMVIDQGYETMEGATGDDWIACAQSMRAYLRFSLLGGVIAQLIRNLGFSAKAHTVMEGDVLQPPLLLLSGLGEVSRIGEVILNPFLGPRLKSGVVTTSLPLAHDKPIDFGLQKFCNSCNKCARECPSGAITAGPKKMFNGYEIWKSDSQKCTTYRITNLGGAMCGRCMKTCPWNLEGIFKEAPFRWAAMNFPKTAPLLARLDDAVGNGEVNPVKKWWWDIEWRDDGSYLPTPNPVNERPLQKQLSLKHQDQTLAVYPADLAPIHVPFPDPMDREKGIAAYQALISPNTYQERLKKGETTNLAPAYKSKRDLGVLQVDITDVEELSEDIILYTFKSVDKSPLPVWRAGAHIDIVIAPEFLRQYSLTGNPNDNSKYQIAVLREDAGKGGSVLMQRIFTRGRRVFISKPRNHFPLRETAQKSIFVGGGIGITPLIAMAHRAYECDMDFELYFCTSTRKNAGFIEALADVPWAKQVKLHISDEGQRADFKSLFSFYEDGTHFYTCGPDKFMAAVIDAAQAGGAPEEACHMEYFTLPELPEYQNHPFTLKLAKSGVTIDVSADESATDALANAGVHVDVKCSDGLCGVCKCGVVGGDVEHRDFVLSKEQRKSQMILCQSRAAKENGVIEIDL